MIKDRTALKPFLNKAATAQDEATRLSTVSALLASPQTVLDHFPMKALRLLRSWLIDALTSATTPPGEQTQALILANLQLLDRIPMTAEGVLESKIGQVVVKVTKLTQLPTQHLTLAKRVSEKLVSIVKSGPETMYVSSASSRKSVLMYGGSTSPREESPPVHRPPPVTGGLSAIAAKLSSQAVDATKTAKPTKIQTSASTRKPSLTPSSTSTTPQKISPTTAAAPAAHAFDIFAGLSQPAKSAPAAESTRPTSQSRAKSRPVAQTTESTLSPVHNVSPSLSSPTTTLSAAPSTLPNPPVTKSLPPSTTKKRGGEEPSSELPAQRRKVEEAKPPAPPPMGAPARKKKQLRVSFAPPASLCSYRQIPARDLNEKMDTRSARDYEIQEGHSARQQFAYVEDEDEEESSFPGATFDQHPNALPHGVKPKGAAPVSFTPHDRRYDDPRSRKRGPGQPMDTPTSHTDAGKNTKRRRFDDERIASIDLNEKEDVNLLLGHLQTLTGRRDYGLEFLSSGPFYRKPIQGAAGMSRYLATLPNMSEAQRRSYMHPLLYPWHVRYMDLLKEAGKPPPPKDLPPTPSITLPPSTSSNLANSRPLLYSAIPPDNAELKALDESGEKDAYLKRLLPPSLFAWHLANQPIAHI